MYLTWEQLKDLMGEPCACGHIFSLHEPCFKTTAPGTFERICVDCGDVMVAEIVASAN
jgi:hypothetical protein